eukprot:744925-Pelagomonas_calceolata.AAC.1
MEANKGVESVERCVCQTSCEGWPAGDPRVPLLVLCAGWRREQKKGIDKYRALRATAKQVVVRHASGC